jgi:transposase-like protein
MTISFARHQPAIVRRAVWLYVCFTPSYRNVEDLLAERGLDVPYENYAEVATRSRARKATQTPPIFEQRRASMNVRRIPFRRKSEDPGDRRNKIGH